MRPGRDFAVEVFYSKHEFTSLYNLSSSDMESLSVAELMEPAGEAAWDEFRRLELGYTQTWGDPALRSALAATFEAVDPDEVLCFSGSEEAIYCAASALLEPGDHAIVIAPNYQSAETLPASICAVSSPVLEAERGWGLDLDELERHFRENTKLLYINFPNNPTGALLSTSELSAIVEMCRARGVRLVSDEIFRGTETDPAARLPQIADLYELGFSLSGASKLYGLAGLRIGWIASKDRVALAKMERVKHFLSICSSAPSEFLARVAIENRSVLVERTRELRARYLAQFDEFFCRHPDTFEWRAPQAGLTAYPRYLGPGTAEAFCRALLREEGVLVLPPSLFRSEFAPLPADRFRVGFTRKITSAALERFDRFIETYEPREPA